MCQNPGWPRVIGFAENSTELLEISGHDGDQDKPWAATGEITGPESVVIDLSSVGLGAAVEGKWTGTGMVWTDGGEVVEGNGVDSWVKVAYDPKYYVLPSTTHDTNVAK